MKTINKILCIFILILIYGCNTQKNKTRVEVCINSTWTKEMLQNTKEELKLKNIDFVYSNLSFGDNGELKSIEINVNCNDGYRGMASREKLSPNSKFGFFRDYSKQNDVQFTVGRCK